MINMLLPRMKLSLVLLVPGQGQSGVPSWDNAGTITDDILQSKSTVSIKATCSDGKRVSFEKAVSSTDYSSYNNIQLNFYIDSADNIAGNIGLMIQTKGSWSNNRYIGFPVFNGWNYIKCNLSEPGSSNTYGTIDLTKVTGFGITVDAKPGKTATIYFDDLKLSRNNLAKAVVIITADDSWKSFYKYGFSKMVAKGFKGTIFQATSLIVSDTSDTNFLTLSHLNSYQNAGFDVANHTHDHNDFESISLAAAIADVALGEQILRNDGFKASRLLAWPIGHFNDSLIQGVKPLC